MIKTTKLAKVLRKAIAAGQYAPGRSIPSERELAEQHEISRTTVRRAIEELVDAGLLTRRPGAGTFVPERLETPATNQKPSTVAFIVPTFSNPLYGEMIDGIEQEARHHDIRVLAGQSNYDSRRESDYLARHARDPSVAGVVLVPARIDTPMAVAQQFVHGGKPLVFVGRWPEGIGADCIAANYRIGARLAVGHLISLGHARIAYIEGLPHLPGFSPYEGYEDALRRAGLPVDPALVKIIDRPSEDAGLRAIRQLVESKIAFTAVFARNDVTASGVIRGLEEAALRIPDDISVASINNSTLAQHMNPPLTGIDPFAVELGRQAFRLLHDRLSGAYQGPNRRITIDPALVIRSSCAPLRKSTRRAAR